MPLHLVRPLGFALDDRYIARAGLDYWPHLDVTIHDTWEEYLAAAKPKRLFFLSTHGEKSLYECSFSEGDALVFGNESSGLPKDFYDRYKESLFKIPMPGDTGMGGRENERRGSWLLTRGPKKISLQTPQEA